MIDGPVLGVDLGTSHTVAMLRWPDGRTRPLLFDGQPLLPSAVYLDTTGRLHVGRDAIRLGQAEPGRIEPHPKRHVDAGTVLLGGAEVPTADLLAAVLGAVAREAVAVAGFLPPAVLTHPAAWGAARREVLTKALARAGWPPTTRLLPEPIAAARYFAEVLRRPVPVGSALAVFDFGGGTLDIAVVRNEGGTPFRFAVTASGGLDDLGGLDLDAALVEHLRAGVEKDHGAAWAALADPVTLAQWRARRQFWEDVRGAKEMLSRTASAPVPVPGVEQAVHLTREEFEATAVPLIRRGVAEAATVLRAAGLAPADLAGLFLVGGSSRVPLVARLLHSELGIAPAVLEQPELPVAEGATIAGVSGDRSGGDGLHGRTQEEAMRPTAVAPQTDTVAHDDGSSRDAADAVLSQEAGVPQAAGVARHQGGSPPAASVAGPAASVAGPAVSAAGPAASAAGPAAPPGAVPTWPNVPDRAAAVHGQPGASGHVDAVHGQLGAPDRVDAVHGQPGAPDRAAAVHGQLGAPDRVDAVRAQPLASGAPGAVAGQPAGYSGGVPGVAPVSPAPQYVEPVDPWATGEAEALAAAGGSPVALPTSGAPVSASPFTPSAEPWLASSLPDPEAAAETPLPAYRKKVFWLVAAVTAVVLAAAATAVALAWPGYPALEFQALTDVRRIPPAVPVTSAFSATAVRDGRAYFASVDDNGTLGVVAAPTDPGGFKPWSSTEAGTAARWEDFFAVPDAVVAITDNDSGTDTRRMVLLDPADGHKLWERVINGGDEVIFTGDTAVLVDRTEQRLLGLEVRGRGKARWESKNPKVTSGITGTNVVAVSTEADFAGPAAVTGTAFAAPLDDDRRIVQIGVDRTARVIDAESGDVLAGPRQGVAAPDDRIVADQGRLIVAEPGETRRIVAYDLEKLGEPRVLYTAPAADTRFESLTPCGTDRVCLIQTVGYDTKTAQVIAIDTAEGGDLWRREVPSTDGLVPVGEAVLARQNTSPAQVTLVQSDGAAAWTEAGVAGRLDGGNLLQFNKTLSASADDPALYGEHLGDARQPLGSLTDVRSATCSWDTKYLACVAAEDFVIQRFAG